ncbi:hypothetical protein EOA60_08280 [Mesorhizobium sp. M1A.F.Ca.IN.020.06.1.1]|uniref:P27 family phage terminase small subunit n=2 Tax=unclassified Mesorhizobium TaxID=325217 RepID=UPI000FCBF838|nr:hypothetical protein EOA51_04595 [Mesorhizobium sp. M1A.F.Ca.IN.020.32.1.1]RUW07820.1 hypothetical protein EOA46_22605 [Mesorhizobium sp. M1A.F.Ca.IN.022.05.2.1]RUW33075.1 hypothetical protein EOA60_08280 [Mesorhizobium sp. M1A.F.Ca.IN.020.06.1.1]RWF81948.1 MAG: hypothetical protein EOQ35_11910 [Mesorhizobium sp.]RWG01361.1 MAG: hypothetical protein EOQ38_12365 [Mesorhizobium sp.]
MEKTPKPPSHLRKPTQKWFRSVVEEYEMEPHNLRLLIRACEAWDRGEEAREAIEAHGLTYTDRWNAPRARPEVAVERDSRIGFARLIRELSLDGAGSPEASRPPRYASYGARR